MKCIKHLLLLLSLVNSSLFIEGDHEKDDITQIFRGCKYSGQNEVYILFSCSSINILLDKQQLVESEKQLQISTLWIKAKKLPKTIRSKLTNFLICDLINNFLGKTSIRLKNIKYTWDPQLTTFQEDVLFYSSSQIDSILIIVGVLKKNDLRSITLSLLPVYPGKVDTLLDFSQELTCESDCNVVGYSQYYNRIRNSLVLVLLDTKVIQVIEFSLIEFKFRKVADYLLNQFSNDQPMSLQFFESGYIIIEFENCQILFSVSQILFQVKKIYEFNKSPLIFLRDLHGRCTKYILQQNQMKTYLFVIEENNNLFSQPAVKLEEAMDVVFTTNIFLIGENQLLFIYDQFELIYKKDFKSQQQANQKQVIISETSTMPPQVNMQLVQYQSLLLEQSSRQFLRETQKQKIIQQQSSCELFYHYWNFSVVPYKQECIAEKLIGYLTNSCNFFDSCYFCMKQIGCYWENNLCNFDSLNSEISNQSNQESSKWYSYKIVKCGEQKVFGQQYTEKILKGAVNTWFYDANELKRFKLSVYVSPQLQIQEGICIGFDNQELCQYFNITEQNNEYIFEGCYFRYIIVYLEDYDLVSSNIQLTIQDLKKTFFYSFIVILFGSTMIFGIVIERIRKRYLYLTQLVDQDNISHLASNELDLRISNLVHQNILVWNQFSPQILNFSEEVCPFCFEKYELSEDILQTFCGHTFHSTCFINWIRVINNFVRCPICNSTVDQFLTRREQLSLKNLVIA